MTGGDAIDALRPDLRGTTIWQRVEEHFRTLHGPSFGRPADPVEPAISADGRIVACTVTVRTDLESAGRQCVMVIGQQDTRLIEREGDGTVRLPRFAPVGDRLALTADDPATGSSSVLVGDAAGPLVELPALAGTVEQLAWSPDGERLIALVAEPGADAAGARGSGRLSRGDVPPWLPVVMADQPTGGWRRTWTIRPGDARWRAASPVGTNCWEVAWCGRDRVLAVVSARPEEAAWFRSRVVLIDLDGGADGVVELARSGGRCVGLPAASPDGARAAWVRGTCSDRTVVAGDVEVVELADLDQRADPVEFLDLGGVDATWIGFRSERGLVVAGQRGLATEIVEVELPAVGQNPSASVPVAVRWSSVETTCGQRYPELAVSAGAIAMVHEGYREPSELVVLDDGGTLSPRSSFRHAGHDAVLRDAGSVVACEWQAPDGQRIEGMLVQPDPGRFGPGPHPCVTYVHGGPVWAWRSRWSMGYPYTLLLARLGFAVFHPNPRGSSGRGEAFRAAVIGDLGGAESDDILSGLDALVADGSVDGDRLAVLGGSHGGFMAAWLVGVTQRFRAAVPYCPVTDWAFMRLTTNDMAAQDHLLAGRPPRDPIAAVERVVTPTLVVTGSNDLITPASQGLAFHRALAERGVPTGYVEYPLEGHGVRGYPAQLDFCARMVGWFEHHLAQRPTPST